jgi:hypothetical protein
VEGSVGEVSSSTSSSSFSVENIAGVPSVIPLELGCVVFVCGIM